VIGDRWRVRNLLIAAVTADGALIVGDRDGGLTAVT
jgi:hypothetical protein